LKKLCVQERAEESWKFQLKFYKYKAVAVIFFVCSALITNSFKYRGRRRVKENVNHELQSVRNVIDTHKLCEINYCSIVARVQTDILYHIIKYLLPKFCFFFCAKINLKKYLFMSCCERLLLLLMSGCLWHMFYNNHQSEIAFATSQVCAVMQFWEILNNSKIIKIIKVCFSHKSC
jgi:hypothetical protein